MKRLRPQLATPDDAEAVFYESFIRCDTPVMTALWADGDVVCVHPGSAAILGHEAVCRSWSTIFSNAQRAQVEYSVVKRTVSNDLAVHIVMEEILTEEADVAIVLATNVYRRYQSGWLMIEHHASLVQRRSNDRTLQ